MGQSCQKADEDGQNGVHLVVAGTEPTIEDEVWIFFFFFLIIDFYEIK